jgi:hypothetical protein
MGVHRARKCDGTVATADWPDHWPATPNNVGKNRRIQTIDGSILHWQIEDEIIRRQSASNQKIIVFQKMRCFEDDRVEFRLGYYMIGLKPKAKGRWVWGQFCLFIPKEDLVALISEAKRRKWL